jgi:prephenate dehydratase
MRVGYLGPEGTFSHEALIDATAGSELELVPLPTIYDTVMAVHSGTVERALVPIENSLEGSVNATLDALAMETEDVRIVGEVVHPIEHCLIARNALELSEIATVVSHPQASAQCARFIRSRLPQSTVLAGSSTAEAVRIVAEHDESWAALGTRLAAARYGCRVLRAGVEDVTDNETRFVWLGHAGAGPFASPVHPDASPVHRDASDVHSAASAGHPAASAGHPAASAAPPPPIGPWKTAIVFWGMGSEAPGWLVRCLSEFASRDVNLTRIESRPRKQGLGRYMFFLDLEGRDSEPHVVEALKGLSEHVEVLRTLGSFPAA